MRSSAYDLTKMSLPELLELQAAVSKAVQRLQETAQAEAKKKIVELAISAGIDLSSIADGVKLYRNPDNFTEVWHATGRKPNWLKQQLAAGKSLEDMRVK